ncbi:hypothetical protein Ct9H90mP29_11470 [bacterium]|nr:MAG: hypothetical protein Ct9H90mP29_11470 [bacterium]
MKKSFKALVTMQNNDGTYINIVKERTTNELPDGDLLIQVEYSSLNYKDALSASGIKGNNYSISSYPWHRCRRHSGKIK